MREETPICRSSSTIAFLRLINDFGSKFLKVTAKKKGWGNEEEEGWGNEEEDKEEGASVEFTCSTAYRIMAVVFSNSQLASQTKVDM